MMSSSSGRKFTPAQLSSNDQAFTGHLYLNPADFKDLCENPGPGCPVQKNAKKIVVKVKGFMLIAEPAADIAAGSVGASSF